MERRQVRFFGLLIVAGMLAVGAANAAVKRDVLVSERDWDAFIDVYDDGAKVCYMRSEPKKWTASKKNVRRGEAYLTVTHWPKRAVFNEVSVITGYTYADGQGVTATIGGKRFKLFTVADSAWMDDENADKAIVEAMKRGSRMVVTGTSSRGTRTTDTYSLMGFSAAYKAITEACR